MILYNDSSYLTIIFIQSREAIMHKKIDKKTRLIEAADKLFYEQGVNITTLANIAALAEVPLGNVYYYFKSKDSIIQAVIVSRRKTLQLQLNSWQALAPKARLKSFIDYHSKQEDQNSYFGDWLGSLCQELCKQKNEMAMLAADLFKDLLQWCENQFKALGKSQEARTLALTFLSDLQGISLLTLALNDPGIIKQQSDYLVNWLEKI